MNTSLILRIALTVTTIGATAFGDTQISAEELDAAIVATVDVSAVSPQYKGLAQEAKIEFAVRVRNAIEDSLKKERPEMGTVTLRPLLYQKLTTMRPTILYVDAAYLEIKAQEVAQLAISLSRLSDSLPVVDTKVVSENIAKLRFSMEQARNVVLELLPPFVTVEQVDRAIEAAIDSAETGARAVEVPFWKQVIPDETLNASLESFSVRYSEGFDLLRERIDTAVQGCRNTKQIPEEKCEELQQVIRQALDDVFGWVLHQFADSSFDENLNALIIEHLESPRLLDLQAQRSALEAARLSDAQAEYDRSFQELMKNRRTQLMAGTSEVALSPSGD